MKRTLVSLLFVLLALPSFGGWSSSGPTGGRVAAVVVAPSDPAVIWAGNTAGVFRSTDGGATWSNAGGAIADVGFVVVHPADANRAWVLTGTRESARLYRTTDGGATWIDSTDGLPPIQPAALLLDPRNPDTLYIGARCGPIGFASKITPLVHETAGVYRSTDAGTTWKAVGGLPGLSVCVEEMALDPFSPWRIFIAGPYSDISGRSETFDAAQTWFKPVDPRPSRGVVFDPRFPFTHYGISAQFGAFFLVSQDGGFSWNSVPGKLPAGPSSLSIDPERGRIFLGTYSGVFRSGNGGRSWANTLVPDVSAFALAFGGVPASLFAATSEGLMQVENRGLGAARTIELRDPSAHVTSVAVDPTNPDVVYAGTRPIASNGGLAPRGRVFRSSNAGASWQRLPNDNDTPKDFLSIDGAGTLYAVTFSGGSLHRRGRNEDSWTTLRNFPFVIDMAADPKNGGTLFVYTGGGLERSRDGGVTWKRVKNASEPGHIAIDPSDSRWVYFGTEFELYRSGDGGDSWTTIEPFDAGKSGTRAIVVAPSDGRVLYRIAANFGTQRIQRSDDRGNSWKRLLLPNDAYPYSIAADPRNAMSFWVSSDRALFHSADGGVTWETVERPFLTTQPASLLRFDPAGRVLHAVWPEHGVWELTLE